MRRARARRPGRDARAASAGWPAALSSASRRADAPAVLSRAIAVALTVGRVVAVVLLAVGAGQAGDAPVDRAQELLDAYDDDPARLDRARATLEEAVRSNPEPVALALLSRTWFLIGEVRARGDDERLAAYAQGREVGRRAVDAAPQSAEAHLWYAINTGRWAYTKGMLRSALELSTVRKEAELVLRLDPSSIAGHALVASLAAELPRALGGDPRAAEEHFRRALELDPRRAAVRVELGRFYIGRRRYAEARRELERALAEPSPTDRPYWVLKVEREARALLESIRGK
jgi:tetratricopeptide (TPR) repeat protein